MIEFGGKAEGSVAPILGGLVMAGAVVLFLGLAVMRQDGGSVHPSVEAADLSIESGSPSLSPDPGSLVAEPDLVEPVHQPDENCINERDNGRSAVCIAEADDSAFLIVADSRAEVKLHSLRSSAMEILSAIERREDRPVGLDFAAAQDVAEVLIIQGATPEEASYQLLYRNASDDVVMFVELASLGVDSQGYEKLAFDSLLAFSSGIDTSVFAGMQAQSAGANEFPYAQYPPVSYASAVSRLDQTYQPAGASESVSKLSVLSDSAGNALWGRSLGYELSVIGLEGQAETVWVDAFLGIEYSRQELDRASANAKQRKSLLQSMGEAQRSRLLRSGALADFLLERVPLSPKEVERRAAKRAHDASFGTSLAGL